MTLPIARLITAFATVSAIERRSRAVRGYKDTKGEMQIECEDIGWFVVLKELGIALGVGDDQPSLEAGDRVRLTIEKAR